MAAPKEKTFGPSPAAVPSLAVLEDDRPVLRTPQARPLLSLHLTAGRAGGTSESEVG